MLQPDSGTAEQWRNMWVGRKLIWPACISEIWNIVNIYRVNAKNSWWFRKTLKIQPWLRKHHTDVRSSQHYQTDVANRGITMIILINPISCTLFFRPCHHRVLRGVEDCPLLVSRPGRLCPPVTERAPIHQLELSVLLLWQEWRGFICSLANVCSQGSQGRKGGARLSMVHP